MVGSPGAAEDEAHQAATVALAVERFGRIDHLVANAGVSPHYGTMMDVDLTALRTALEVNVTAVLGWTQQVWRAGMAEHGGSVLNVSSISGLRAGAPIGAYVASKAALLLLTQQLAVELAPHVRVNALAPGIVKTVFSAAFWEGMEEEVAAGHPLKRLGTPADTAKAACFLLSDDASWITGQTLIVDGGLLAGT